MLAKYQPKSEITTLKQKQMDFKTKKQEEDDHIQSDKVLNQPGSNSKLKSM